MKNGILALMILIFAICLAACANSGAQDDAATPAATEEGTNPAGASKSLPLSTRLLIGSVILEGTENAIQPDQAAQLVPLWKALRSLSESETTAQVELDALVDQIAENMTPAQNEAIAGMSLTMQDLAAVAETLGLDLNFGGRFGELTPELRATTQAMRESGQLPEGMPSPGGDMPATGSSGDPALGGEFEGGGGFNRGLRATAQAEGGNAPGASPGINSTLLEAFIAFLEAKTP
jgi:hypothetical protein